MPVIDHSCTKYTLEGWNICFTPQGKFLAAGINPDSSESLSDLLEVRRVLKYGERSLVLLIAHLGNRYVFKIPREKNRRKWIRFTTLYRNSEVKKNFINLVKLANLGISSNSTPFFMEKRELKEKSLILFSSIVIWKVTQ